MYLKRIEIHGFKSFADRTRIDFPSGITAVVGPNGSGKSNVVDAIRWVLGEQSVKSLRGHEMTDVIFAGTSSRPPLGYAEVTLLFDNRTGLFPAPHAEIAITRRLYRSGESEYLLNRNACRLRDIQELLMDSGIGKRAHVIIEQGKIEEVVTSKPEARRVLFEEAAGIAKYRFRREEASRKLDLVGANLGRLRDRLAEIQAREATLRRQAGQAERYVEAKKELRDLEGLLARVRLRDLSARAAALAGEIEEAGRLRRAAEEALAGAETLAREAQTAEDAAGESLAGAREEVRRAAAARATAEGDVRLWEGKIEAFALEAQRARARLAQDEEKARAIEGECGEAHEAAAELGTATAQALAELEREKYRAEEALAAARASEEKASEAEGRWKEAYEGLETARRKIEEARAEVAVRREEASLSRARCEALRSKGEEARAAVAAAEAECAGRDEAGRARACDAREARARAEEAAAKRRQAEEILRAAEKCRAETEARLGAAEEGRAGRDKVRAEIASGALDAVEDLLPTGSLGDHALVGALLPHIHAILWPSPTPSAEEIERVRRTSRSIEILLPSQGSADPAPGVGPDGAPPLSRRLPLDIPRREVLASLLARVYEAPSLEWALARRTGLGAGERFATPQGELVGPAQIRFGLARAGSLESPVLARRAAEEAAADENRARASWDEVAAGEKAAEDSAREAEARAMLASAEASSAWKAFENAGRELAEIGARLGEAEKETARCTAAADEAEGVLRDRSTAEAEARLTQAAAVRDATASDVKPAREAARGAEAGLAGARARHDLLTSRREEAIRRGEDLTRALRETRDRAEGEKVRIGEIAGETARAEESARSSREGLRAAIEAEAGADGAAQAAHEALTARRAERGEAEARQNEARAKREEAGERAHEAERESAGRAAEIKSLCENHSANFEEDLLPASAEEALPEGAEGQITLLKNRIARMGGVNFQAAEELAEAAARLAEAAAEEKDLSGAEADLRTVIVRMDEETQKVFLETFQAVATNFSVLFQRLFEGGEAEIVLLDPDHPLQSGVEIVARPPGKKPQSISLLSGGEKAMTAIGLLFSVFLVRPSPFSVLDELDAPLDEANIGRYTRLLREFSKKTQFLIITHNKSTMEMAETLYGVTMEEKGVSKVLSVTLSEVENDMQQVERVG